MANRDARSLWTIIGIVTLAIGAIVWGLASTGGSAQAKSNVPEGFSVDALNKQLDDPGSMFEKLRGLRDRDDLTDEQRRAIRENMRTVMTAALDARIKQYNSAAPEDKNAVLDQQIDDFQAMRESFRERREDRDGDRDGGGPPDRGGWRSMSQQERKERTENRDPNKMAQRMAYFAAVRARAQERGIDISRGGPFGRRGGGGSNRAGRRGP